MTVRDIMTQNVQACQPETDLAAVAKLMWDFDCGFIPVVGPSGALVGAITDRDICMAVTTRRLLPERIAAGQAMSAPVHACMPGDTISSALGVMKQFKVRRLPVIDASGAPVGVITMNDIVLAAEKGKSVPAKEVVSALAGICAHRSIEVAVA